MKKKDKIGIISGAGPMAGALLYKKIIENYQTQWGAVQDQDFPEIALINYPFSAMLSGLESASNECRLRSELEICLVQLRNLGCKRVGIACNTLYAFLPPCLEGIEIIDMPAISLQEANRRSLHPSSGSLHGNY